MKLLMPLLASVLAKVWRWRGSGPPVDARDSFGRLELALDRALAVWSPVRCEEDVLAHDGKALAEIVVRQWETATRLLLDDLEQLPTESWCVASYDHLIADPSAEILRLSRFVGVRWDRELEVPLSQSQHTLTPPDPEKWRANFEELEPWQTLAAATAERARDLFARAPLRRAAPPPPPFPQSAESEDHLAFRSVHTSNVPQILKEIRSSLLVSTC